VASIALKEYPKLLPFHTHTHTNSHTNTNAHTQTKTHTHTNTNTHILTHTNEWKNYSLNNSCSENENNNDGDFSIYFDLVFALGSVEVASGAAGEAALANRATASTIFPIDRVCIKKQANEIDG
jgi:hypothetical protein